MKTGGIDINPNADRWREQQRRMQHTPTTRPNRQQSISINSTQTDNSIHRDDTTDYIDGTEASRGQYHNVSRANDLQHRIGSVPVRLAKRGRNGAQFNIRMERRPNTRDMRRMAEYNARKERRCKGTSL